MKTLYGSITETCHPTDKLSPTASNLVRLVVLPEVTMPKKYKSKCKKHRREARGW